MVLEEEFELTGDVGSRDVNGFVAKKLFLHPGKLFLGRIDLLEDQR